MTELSFVFCLGTAYPILDTEKAYLSRVNVGDEVSYIKDFRFKGGYKQYDNVSKFRESVKRYEQKYGKPMEVLLGGRTFTEGDARKLYSFLMDEVVK